MVDTSLFKERAPKVMRDLIAEFDIDEIQAAGILGNLGTECAGFHILHEIGQPEGKGGYGWFQWTGARRKSFFDWCKKKRLKWESAEANYGYLLFELHSAYSRSIAALEKAHTIDAAVFSFERTYESAGTPNYPDRQKWAHIALDAYRNS